MTTSRPAPPPVLLLHPPPGEDEVFSSWITRVALANDLRPPALVLALGHGQVFRSDPDLSAPDDLLISLASSTRQDPGRILQTGLRPMLTHIHGEVRPTAHLAFLVTPGSSRGVDHARGHPACLGCLAEDGQLRRSWRLTTTVVCERHGLVLMDQCRHCGCPFSLLRPQLARATRRRAPTTQSVSCCPRCRQWMGPGDRPDPQLLEAAALIQNWMGQAVTLGRVELPDLSLSAPDFAELLTITLALVRNRPRLASRLVLPPAFQEPVFRGKPMLEYASPDQRLPLIAGAGLLLQDGVTGLFGVLQDAGIKSREVFLGQPVSQIAPWLRNLNFDALSHRPHARRLVPLALQVSDVPVVFTEPQWTKLAPLLPSIARGGGGKSGRKSDREALEAALTRALAGTRQIDWQGKTSYVTFYRRLGRLVDKGCLDTFLQGVVTLLEQELGTTLPGSEANWAQLAESTRRLLLALTSAELVRALERVGSTFAPLLWRAGTALSVARTQELLRENT